MLTHIKVVQACAKSLEVKKTREHMNITIQKILLFPSPLIIDTNFIVFQINYKDSLHELSRVRKCLKRLAKFLLFFGSILSYKRYTNNY